MSKFKINKYNYIDKSKVGRILNVFIYSFIKGKMILELFLEYKKFPP
jgi:hypothetical protein